MTTGSTALASKPLHALLGEGPHAASAEGALTVVLGGMGAGKNAVGLAYARTVLHHGGFVLICQPGDRGKLAMRVPVELERRLGTSMSGISDAGKKWRERLHVLTAAFATADSARDGAAGTARGASGFAGVLAHGPLFPEESEKANWRNRMVVVQDYNLLWRTEPDLTPARLRGLALHHRINIVLLADVTGGDREIARLAGPPIAAQDAAMISLLRPVVDDGRLEAEELAFLREHLPRVAQALERGELPREVGASSTRAVRVHPGQVLLAEAAHRLVYVEKATATSLLLHTLKSQQVPPAARELELDAGFLAWPPERLHDPQQVDRERLPRVGPSAEGALAGEPAPQESPRG